MICHYLNQYSTRHSRWQVATCSARGYLYVPSLGDLNASCRCQRHQLCPYYLLSTKRVAGPKPAAGLPCAPA